MSCAVLSSLEGSWRALNPKSLLKTSGPFCRLPVPGSAQLLLEPGVPTSIFLESGLLEDLGTAMTWLSIQSSGAEKPGSEPLQEIRSRWDYHDTVLY